MTTKSTVALGTASAFSSFGSVALSLTGWMQSAEGWLRVTTIGIGAAGAVLTLIWMNRINRVKLQVQYERLCEICRRRGERPGRCPVRRVDRPGSCPLKEQAE